MIKELPSFCDMPYLITQDDLVIELGLSFTNLTGYSNCSFLHKNISKLFKLLRMNITLLDIENAQTDKDIFLFTKDLEPMEVEVSVRQFDDASEKLYIFTEKPDSRLADKFAFVEQLFNDNKVGCVVYSVPDLVILKTNTKLLEFIIPSPNKKNKIVGTKPNLKGGVDKIFSTVLKTGKTFSFEEYKYDYSERGYTYWDGYMSPIFVDKKIKYIFQYAVDVTQRVVDKVKIISQKIEIEMQKNELEARIDKQKRAEEKLAKVHKNKIEILESVNDGFYSLDEEWRFTYINKWAAEKFGCKQRDLLNKNLWSVFPFTKGSLLETNLRKVMSTQEQVQFEIAGFISNRLYFFSVSPTQEGVSVFFIDITDRKKIEKKLKFQENQLVAIIENMNDPTIIYDKTGAMVLINAEARKLYPHLNEQTTLIEAYVGAECFNLDNTLIPVENLPTYRVFKGETIRNERMIIRYPTWEKVMEINATPILDDSGNLVSALVRHHDVTDSVNNQLQLDKKQKELLQVEKEKNDILQREMAMKDEFFSLMSHEFRTPISVINAAVQAIELSCKDELSKRAITYIDMIKQNSNRQLKLANNILDITRLNASHVSMDMQDWDIVDLTRSITESILVIAEQKGLKLLFLSKLKEKIICIDEEKYERIILNILSNAFKFTPKGNTISVKVFETNKANTISIQVEDQGIGIPHDKQDLIFEKFGQVNTSISRSAEGTGIGLSLVKMLVKLMNGEITLQSEVGVGSTFTVILPNQRINDEPELQVKHVPEDHLNRAIAIEFSDVYL